MEVINLLNLIQDSKHNEIALVPAEPLTACSTFDHSYENQFVLAIRGYVCIYDVYES